MTAAVERAELAEISRQSIARVFCEERGSKEVDVKTLHVLMGVFKRNDPLKVQAWIREAVLQFNPKSPDSKFARYLAFRETGGFD